MFGGGPVNTGVRLLNEYRMRVELVAHNPHWKLAYEMEAAQIARGLGDLVAAIHHIGSTAIPGIVAKPVIDILVEVSDLERLDAATLALEELGYEAKGEFGIPGRRYFRKNDATGRRTYQLHAFRAGSGDVERHLAFRDYMIVHSGEARRYGALKQRLADEHPDDMEAYMDGKDAYIKEQERRAVRWRSARGSSGSAA